ncbi:hypothetical protein ACFLQL_03700 [Verrucomicrobiota bacterium]
MDKEQKLTEQFIKISAQLNDAREEKRTKDNKKLTGKYFKYHNSIGSDHSKWWLYVKITGAGRWWPEGISFERTCLGEFRIRQNDFPSVDSYEEISKKEFTKAWLKFYQSITDDIARRI